MTFAILTAILFAGSAICNTRISSLLDTIAANLGRLLIAVVALGILTFVLDPNSFHPSGCLWLLLSGFVGFGIGDIALFSAFLRIGSRVTVLVNFCLGTIIGAVGDTLLLGDHVSFPEWGAIAIIFAGLALALLAQKRKGARHGSLAAGFAAAIIGAFGQGLGATLSRKAEYVAMADDVAIGGISAAFQRVLAGVACLLIVYFWRRARGNLAKPKVPAKRYMPWLICAAMFGPVLGVSCFQQALSVVGNSGIVMAVVATSPLLLIPLAYVFEGDKPTRLSIVGALVGVAGVIVLGAIRIAL